ncbi:MAG: beta-N-acetylhexosaminidase [Alteromonadaceae bacterium]|nr:beta-N-acetylhexosaminidase [Alteromonadaceae bacterium]
MGPIMLDVQGTSLLAEDKELLEHPLVGGLILFSRNYQSPEQVSALTQEIRKAAKSDILIAVDQEGGRVQRFREQFSTIPAMGAIWRCAEGDVKLAKLIARNCGILMALEVQAVGIDISLAPVLDINGISEVIGERAFHQQPEQVIELASSFIDGMQQVGMKSTGKHFPGHGSVQADSHHALPIDSRSKQQIIDLDLLPFKNLIAAQKINAIMPAHIVYPDVDSQSVGFSHYWLQEVLREALAFDGVIFSDDLSMEGAASIGGYVERAEAAQQAGCDMLLLCNNRQGCIEVIDNANIEITSSCSERLKALLKTSRITWPDLAENVMWQQSRSFVSEHVFVNDKK